MALTVLAGSAYAQQKPAQMCRDVTFESASYTVCTVDLRTHDLRLAWKAPGGDVYGTLGTFARAATRAGNPPSFAMNAGMYHADGRPVGLYVEGGRELARISTARGPGNFHLKPNGVFYVTATEAGVMETARYIKTKPEAQFATQSGPMLVIDGKLHPRFSADGPSLKIRNGVGVRDGQTVMFAISNEGVSFGSFGRLFRDQLKCANALYLDGSISSLWAPSSGRQDEFWPVGPIVAAVPKVAGKAAAPKQ
ncbi:MAG: phosphodiester glycosidase family protein [Hyphomicrobiaceae bacterium]|nr:phosphodiester glycosidase family protein [Hyphomicrobiaceae bacterium]